MLVELFGFRLLVFVLFILMLLLLSFLHPLVLDVPEFIDRHDIFNLTLFLISEKLNLFIFMKIIIFAFVSTVTTSSLIFL